MRQARDLNGKLEARRTSRSLALAVGLLLALALPAAPRALAQNAVGTGPAAGSSAEAVAVLAAAKAATGGAAWDRISGWRERGRHGQDAYETLLDFRRYGARYTNTRDGKTRVHGFNGSVDWGQTPDGKVTISRDAASLAEARKSAYFSTFAFFLPARFPARFEYLGVQSEGGASFDIVRVTPRGATPIEVWVDRATHLPARLVDRSGAKPDIARCSDYRAVGSVREPFRIEDGDGDPSHVQTLQVDSVVLGPIDRRAFDPPR